MTPPKTITHFNFPSEYVLPRHIHVWLPPGYPDDAPYPVLYMHDGQNLFEGSESAVDWGIEPAMLHLIEAGEIPPAIVVGVWNTHLRYEEYMPQKALKLRPIVRMFTSALQRIRGQNVVSDLYLQFLVEELKPFIDREYQTAPGRETTSVMGSSMGALISMYAVCEYPDVFGGAGCVSTHWPFGKGICVEYFSQAVPDAGEHRWYFDYGTLTLDASYEPYQDQVDEIMKATGYTPDVDWKTVKFEGHEHSETYWRQRVDIPLRLLLASRP